MTNIKIVEHIVQELPVERPLVAGHKYKVVQSDGTLIEYVVNSQGAPVRLKGITNDESSRLDRLSSDQISKVESITTGDISKLKDLDSQNETDSKLNSKVDKESGKSLVEDGLIEKLEEDYTKAEIDTKISDLGNLATSSKVSLGNSTVLPVPPQSEGVTIPNAWVELAQNVTYTQSGGSPITGIDGHRSIAEWDNDNEVWSLVDMGELPTIPVDGVVEEGNPNAVSGGEVFNSTKYLDFLIEKVNSLDEKIQEIEEKDEALIIDNTSPTISSQVTMSPSLEIPVDTTSGNTIYGNFAAWGGSKYFPATVEYDDGSLENILILSFSSSEAVAANVFDKTVVKVSNVHNSSLGQHLSDLASKEMGYRLYHSDLRQSYRQELVKGINFAHHTSTGGVFVDSTTSEEVLRVTGVEGFPSGWFTVAAETVDYYSNNTPRATTITTNTAGQGIQFDFSSDYKGFLEIFIGTKVHGGVVGGVKVQLYKDELLIKEEAVRGAVKRVILEHEDGNYKVRIVSTTADPTSQRTSGIYWWRKRELPSQSIFKSTDRVLFLTDSWGTFPEETNPSFQTVAFDGHLINGRCYMPQKFTEEFVANGGSTENVLLATRGGMTTAWARHWLPYLINETNPDKIIFHFGINDMNSKNIHSNPNNAYRFDPDNIWGTKNIEDGGMVGSIPNNDAYKMNIIWLKDFCVKRGVTPVFFTPPKTAASSQAQELANLARDVFFSGIN